MSKSPRTKTKQAASQKPMVRLLKLLIRGEARRQQGEGSDIDILFADGTAAGFPLSIIAEARASGLIEEQGDLLRASNQARAYLRRAAAEADEVFLTQHAEIETSAREVDGVVRRLRVNKDESPLASIERLKDRDGAAFMPEAAIKAGERLHADFTRAQLQPRVTASWEPRLSSRASGGRGGMADLTDSAVAARLAVNRALEALGPELSGVALDVCCFMKGLETVERERQWPVRSAKLMLRTALMALSRHYNPQPPSRRPRMEHWGAPDYRPELWS
ncbi:MULTISPECIES: DUF6456 domain-containing protein [unclassified Rhizobium]|uniref:DUF6456 domain-containing protein n=1 Tax=unclassified Rhizobium TaxID=2613769 RepID=UPI001ADA604F|nr:MULTISPECIES: DUF6456 domain-containing protein [unclassified Rhizobium]MBO9123200.1 hypothetical protein [Rhizobium sp. 16-488-2b]MBO9173732.1 hypothetical protein [Rhizobium sp. 16-488-2a]